MKKFICVLSVIAILFSFCACGNENTHVESENATTTTTEASNDENIKKTNSKKSALNVAQITSILQDNGFTVSSGTYGASENIYWSDYKECIAATKSGEIAIVFSVCDTEEKAKQNADIIDQMYINAGQTPKGEEGKNYEKYIFDKEAYWTVIRVDNTAMYISGRLKSKEDIDLIANKLGY